MSDPIHEIAVRVSPDLAGLDPEAAAELRRRDLEAQQVLLRVSDEWAALRVKARRATRQIRCRFYGHLFARGTGARWLARPIARAIERRERRLA